MTERTAIVLWVLAALLVAVASGATTMAVLSDEETVSIEVSAADDSPAPEETTPDANEPETGDRPAADDPVEPVVASAFGMHARVSSPL